MSSRRLAFFVVALGLIFGGLLALIALERQHGLGRYAESPQRLEIELGRKAIVGGGRGLLWVAPAHRETAPAAPAAGDDHPLELELRCREEKRRFLLEIGDWSRQICGVEVKLVGVWGAVGSSQDPRRAFVEIRWRETSVIAPPASWDEAQP